jgi:CheY-like chemotaxis protein
VPLATDGLEALQAASAGPPDFLALDLIMLRVDGGRVCRYLWEDSRHRHITILVFSALAAEDIAAMQDVAAAASVAKDPLPTVTKASWPPSNTRSVPADPPPSRRLFSATKVSARGDWRANC